MSTVLELSNLGGGGVGAVLGTNSKKALLKQITSTRSIWFWAPGSSIATDAEFDLTAIQLLQAQGKLIVLQGINTFEETGNEDNVETLDDSTEIVTNEAKYTFLATFTNGLDFNKALHTIKGFGNWNASLVSSKGDILGTSDTSAGFTGFDTGKVQPMKLQIGTTQAGQKEGISFQLLDRNELDTNFVMIEKLNLNFDPLKVEGISEILLTYVNTPAATDTIVTIKATYSDRKTAFAGLPYALFLRISDGATENPTGGDDSSLAGTYVLTVAAISENEVETIELYDNSNNRDVVLNAGDLSQSQTVGATAVA